jgi:hypothetical protein
MQPDDLTRVRHMFEAVENVLRFICGKNPNFPRELLANIQSVNREYSSKITRRGGLLRQLAGAFEVFQAPGGAFALTFSTRARVPIIARLTSPCGRTASKLFILRIRTSLNRKRRRSVLTPMSRVEQDIFLAWIRRSAWTGSIT